MKKCFLWVIPFLIFGCNEKATQEESGEVEVTGTAIELTEEKEDELEAQEEEEEESISDKPFFEGFSWSSDTLVIDPGNSLINLRQGISKSSLSSDKKELRVYSASSDVLYRIDLDKRKLISEAKFEKEGPNGVPAPVWYFQDLGNEIFLSGYQKIGIYSLDGKKVKDLAISEQALPGLNDFQQETLSHALKINKEKNKLFSLPRNRGEEKLALAIVDLSTQQGKLVDLPKFGFLTQFDVMFRQGIHSSEFNGATLASLLEKDRLLIYSQGANGIYNYNLKTGSLTYYSPDHQLVPKVLSAFRTKRFSSPQEIEEASLFWRSQIKFHDLIYDEQRDVYFRFGEILEDSETLDSWPDSEVYLFGFDKDFKLLGEIKLKGFKKVPLFPFFKDGKLWSYVNVDDELGFAIVTLNF